MYHIFYIMVIFVLCFSPKNEAIKWVESGKSIVVLTKHGNSVDNYVSVFSSNIDNFDLALSNCEQAAENYQKLYTDGNSFGCYRVK